MLDSSNISCFGFNDGYLQLDASGILDDYNYQLQLYDSLFSTSITVGQTPFPGIYTSNPVLFPNLYSGCYRVIVTDSLLCSDTVTTCLTQPFPIIFDVIITNANNIQNNNGSIELVNISGGNYSYVFSGVDQNGLSITSNANLFDNLQSGLYTVTVTDSVGCF